jgi:glycosyltransferase involved in cell wall biosynthesis
MSGNLSPESPRLLFVVTEDWYFCSHRLPLAIAAKNAGYQVAVATRVSTHADVIRAAGIELFPLQSLRRSSVNPWREARAVAELIDLYRRWQPTLIHHVAIKPVIYGSIAAQVCGIDLRVNALAGLGYVFSSDRVKARLLQPAVRLAYRYALRRSGSRTIVQNPDDAQLLARLRIADSAQVRLVSGAGVDLRRFAYSPPPSGRPMVMLMSRMLWDKGVGEFVAAAEQLRLEGVDARFVLAGDPDPENPAAIPVAQLEDWRRGGAVEWWGHCSDAAEALRQASVVCLPSYREGLPKVLLEGAALGRALVTSDVPGCREVVRNRVTGLLVPPRDPKALADALRTLLADPAASDSMGRNASAMAAQRFGVDAINTQTLAIYDELLAECVRS